MSHVLFYSVFCSFVIFLFNFLHPSNQPSVQKSSAQPFVTEAVLDSISESELSASASLASLQQITSAVASVIMAMSAAIKRSTILSQRMWSWCQLIQSSSSTFKISQQLSQQRSGPTSQCQVSPSVVHLLQTHWSSMPSWLHCHHQGWTCVTCQMMSSCSHQLQDIRRHIRLQTVHGLTSSALLADPQ